MINFYAGWQARSRQEGWRPTKTSHMSSNRDNVHMSSNRDKCF
jgi:hypothetical protein